MTQPTPRADGKIYIEDLGEANIIRFRNEAIGLGNYAAANAFDKMLEAGKNPDLYRHSRRRK